MSIFLHYDMRHIHKIAPVSVVLFLLNWLMFIGQQVTFNTRFDFNQLGALYPPYVHDGEYYRLLTAMFLHANFSHILFNTLFGIMIVGAGLEKLIGSKKYLLVYFVTGLLSSLSVYIFNYNYWTIGASGAIFGVLGVLLYVALMQKEMLIQQDIHYIYTLLLINIVFTFLPYINFSANSKISIPGHLGGLVAGFILGFALFPKDRRLKYYGR